MAIEQELQKLEPGALVELFKVDVSINGGPVMYFHGHPHIGSIWWNDQEYLPYPIQTEDFQITTDRPPMPKLTVANLDGYISVLCAQYDDFVGARVTRTRTLGAYLDAVNFHDPNILIGADFRDDVSGWTLNALDGSSTWTWISPGVARAADGMTASKTVAVTAGTQYIIKAMIVTKIGASSIKVYDHTTNSLLATLSQQGETNWSTFTPATNTIRVEAITPDGGELRIGPITVAKYIGNPTADPTQEMKPEIWYIDRKAVEDNKMVQFELASAMDLNGVQLPRRQIVQNYCTWMSVGGYRGPYCNYTGVPVAKADGTPTSDPLLDKCGGKLSDCKLRQWPDGILNFGGYPAAGLVRV